MKVLKKATIVRKKKVMEHTLTERSVLESIREFPFLVTLHYAFQTNAKLHLIMGKKNNFLEVGSSCDRLFPKCIWNFEEYLSVRKKPSLWVLENGHVGAACLCIDFVRDI